MLDWFSGYVGYDASQMVLGRVLLTLPGGEIEREHERWETARGSYEAGVQVTRGEPTAAMLAAARDFGFLCSDRAVLRVSGNPAKFLQGHNAAGPSVSWLGPILRGMVRSFAEGLRPTDADDERLPAVHRSRVDITTAVDMGSHESVHEWLRLAAAVTRSKHGRAIDSSGTVYWGKNSRRWSLKAYCKHCELKAHPVIVRDLADELLEWSRPHLRIELTLRRPELKEKEGLDETLIWDYLRRLEIPTMKESGNLRNVELPTGARAALQIWLDGHDVVSFFPRATTYRHRRTILDVAGVDITRSVSEQVDQDPDALMGVEELQRREVVEIPDRIQRSLFGAG